MSRLATRSADTRHVSDARQSFGHAGSHAASRPMTGATSANVSLAREMLRLQRDRAKFLPGDLFCDPAWSMLLELYVLDASGRPISVSGLCAASEIPHTTALRWIGRLVDSQLVDRLPDQLDARRTWLKLTDKGREQLEAYFSATKDGRD